MSGYFGIGIENGKTELNTGTLWRSAYNFSAAYIFTVGRRYKSQCSDTLKTWRQIPMLCFENIEEFIIPRDCLLIGIEIIEGAISLPVFSHPKRAVYLLGAEDHGLSKAAQQRCHQFIEIPSRQCLNVAVAGAIVMYDRMTKELK